MSRLACGGFRFDNCDPPHSQNPMTKLISKKAYTDLNMRCMELLKEGGILMTSSCSGRITQEDFRDILKFRQEDR